MFGEEANYHDRSVDAIMIFRTLVLIFFLFTKLFSSEKFDYNMTISNSHPVVKEAVIVTAILYQKENAMMHFDLDIPDSKFYRVKFSERIKSKDVNNRATTVLKYILYPLSEGNFTVKPILNIKQASKEELKKFVTGSADELDYLQTQNRSFKLDPFRLEVKKLDSNVVLVGDYKLVCQIDQDNIHDNEQLNVMCTLSGEGYKPNIQNLLAQIKDVDIFLDKDVKNQKLYYKIVYYYALKANHNYTIPSVVIKCFNPKTKKNYHLKTERYDVTVTPIDDEVSAEKAQDMSISLEKYFNYLLIFIAGFLMQKLLVRIPRKKLSGEALFTEKIKKSKEPKELLKLLLTYHDRRFKKEIYLLEEMIYQNRAHKLSSIKSSLLKRQSVISKNLI